MKKAPPDIVPNFSQIQPFLGSLGCLKGFGPMGA